MLPVAFWVLALLTSTQVSAFPSHLPQTGCTHLVDQLCSELMLPPHRGDLEVGHGESAVRIRMGLTRIGSHPEDTRELELRLDAIRRYPLDFSEALKRQRYAENVRSLLSTTDLSKARERQRELDQGWRNALEDAALRRMEARHPGYSVTPAYWTPTFLRSEHERIQWELSAEVNRLTWQDTPEWKKVSTLFEGIRDDMREVVRSSARVPEKRKAQFLERLKSVRLIPPRSLPESQDPCEQDNAFYYPKENAILLCPAQMVSYDPSWTLAHELGHSLGIDRSTLLAKTDSLYGRRLLPIARAECEGRPVDCAGWQELKRGIDSDLASIPTIEPWNPKLYACLSRAPVKRASTQALSEHAEEFVSEQINDHAWHSEFLELSKPETMSPSGERIANPSRGNPCRLGGGIGLAFEKEPILNPVPAFFVAESTCRKDSNPESSFRFSIETTEELARRVTLQEMRSQGKYSPFESLIQAHLSEDLEEQSADVLASEVLARRLMRIPDLELRRKHYLSNIAVLCEQPSARLLYPAEAEVEDDFARTKYSLGGRRRQETLRAPMREALQCRKDFEIKD